MMAGHRWLIPPVQGLLLCILALQFHLQDSLAAAEHNTAVKTMVMATKNLAEATKNTSVATKNALVVAATTKKASVVAVTTKNTSVVAAATKNTSVATKNALVVPATIKKASLVAVATKNTSVATQNASVATQNATVVVITKNAMVVAATKNAAGMATANTTSVAPRNTLVVAKATKNTLAATRNASVVTTATKDTSAATKNAVVVATATKSHSAAAKNALVVAATTKKASAATKNISVVAVTKNATVVATTNNISEATNNASVVATNTSMNGVEETTLTCQSFQCSGERCYQDEAHANRTITCWNETYCELYRFSGTNYTAGCSSRCSTELCRTNTSVSRQQCALECCASPLCLQLKASAYGDLPPTTVPPTTTTTTTTPRSPPQNGKVCAAFSCHGDGCFKGRTTVSRCILGQDFCEMKKMGLNYVAGCSKACKAAKPVCAGGMKAACYQECCPATPKASCLKLDGKVHVNSAGEVTLAPLLKVMACGLVLLLNYRVSASLWG